MSFFVSPEGDKYYPSQKFTYNGIRYTRAGATPEMFTSLGFREVVPADAPNSKYYNYTGPNSDGQYDITAKDLDECKTLEVAETKRIAAAYLEQTDWYVVRKADTGAAIPDSVTTFRAAVRTVSGQREALINATTTVAELETLCNEPAFLVDRETSTLSPNPATHLTPWPTAE